MTHSILSSHFAQVQQSLPRDIPSKALIGNSYSSSLGDTRIRGNLRAFAAMAGIATVEDIVIAIGRPIGASGARSADVARRSKRAVRALA